MQHQDKNNQHSGFFKYHYNLCSEIASFQLPRASCPREALPNHNFCHMLEIVNCDVSNKTICVLCIVYIFEGILGNPFQRAFSFFWSEWWFTSSDRTLCDTNSKPFLCANFWSGTTIPRKAHFVLNNNVIFLYFSKFYTVQNVNAKKHAE